MIQAVRDLDVHLRRYPWFLGASQGCGCILVTVARMPAGRERSALPQSYGGYPCRVISQAEEDPR